MKPESSGEDPRFTHGLIFDIHKVLHQHGYKPPGPGPDGDESRTHRAYGSMVSSLYRLVRAFEGIDDEAGDGVG